MRTPYACIQDDDDSFLFLEAKNFCCSLLYCLAWCCRFCIPVLLASTLTGLYIQAQFFSLGSIISIVQLCQTLNPIQNHCNFRREDGGTIHLGPIIHTSIFFFFFHSCSSKQKTFAHLYFFSKLWRPERECEKRDLLPQPASSSRPVDTFILADFSSFSPLSTTNAATVSW